jgi:predicted PurR-regulated permease PerM
MSTANKAPSEPNPTPKSNAQTYARWGLVALALLIVIALLAASWQALAPFLIGLVLLYLLSPAVNMLSKKLPRWLSILIVYWVVAGLLVAFFWLVVPPLATQVQRLINAIPSIDKLQADFNLLLDVYRRNVPDSVKAPIDSALRSALATVQSNISSYVQNVLGFLLTQVSNVVGIITFIVGLLIIPIWLFYVLHDQRQAHLFLNRMLHFRIRPDFWNVWNIIDRSLSAYIRGQVTLGLIIGVAVGVGLSVIDLVPGLDIDYILLLAIWAGICELIPMIGAILGGTPGVILAFVIGGPTTGIVVLIMYVVVQQVENNFLVPRIIGDSVGVHPAILTVTLIIGASVFGLLGVVLAAPATAIARDLYLYAYNRLSGKNPTEAYADRVA